MTTEHTPAARGADPVLARQRAALAHACLLAGETVHPRFAWCEGAFSHVLTVNAGYE